MWVTRGNREKIRDLKEV